MGFTTKEDSFIQIFKNSLKIDARTISVKTLLSERNLSRINYTPYYQRNYVWDTIKQSFFIESVILGTEIPPLIFFKSKGRIEVIDGRQRFETLKKFKENDIALNSKGLMELPALARKSFNTLDSAVQDVFWNSNIRIFEFEIINEPNIDSEVEDKVKKEIFRRYNTGITPLTAFEIDSAKYNEDIFSIKLKKMLDKDTLLYERVKACFFHTEEDSPDLKNEMLSYLRKCFILNKYPISRYARGNDRTEIIELLYETVKDNMENVDDEIAKYTNQIYLVYFLYKAFDSKRLINNKLIYECLLWAIRILEEDNVDFNYSTYVEMIKNHFETNIDKYSLFDTHFRRSVIDRFHDTASLFYQLTGYNFDIFIRDENFNEKLKDIRQNESKAKDIIAQLEQLRINKPSPISRPIDQIKDDVITDKYLLRPSYQRQEKITILKASSIIESILLGINLPPIFIYLRKDKTKEVIDGQQRLLSIIGFMGREYKDENGKLSRSKNNNFKLKGLKILTDLNGKNYTDLGAQLQDKILDFDIDEIIIEEGLNAGFDQTDLFIRLNQKPYPILQNSFEMWNSTVDKDVVQKIKKVTNEHISWFYIKESDIDPTKRTDRMENEEFISILSYIVWNNRINPFDKILGIFGRKDRITFRIKNKTALTDFLNKLEKDASEKEIFIDCVEKTNSLIKSFGSLFISTNKEDLNNFFNVKGSKTFIRSLQDFYITWIIIDKISSDVIYAKKDDIKGDIHHMLCLLRNKDGAFVDDKYTNDFKEGMDSVISKYSV